MITTMSFRRVYRLEIRLKDVLEDEVDEKYYLPKEILKKFKLFNKPMCDSGISVAGSLNPSKECQDRVRVLGTSGICQGLRATDYKDPPKILIQAGSLNHYKNDQMNRAYDTAGIAPTIETISGGGRETEIIEPNDSVSILSDELVETHTV